MISSAASDVFKKDDKSKIFFDEYELSVVNDSIVPKIVKHVTYNIDDIAEVVIPT
ncbi:MAG: hypothetical protein ACPHY8_04215 [Patescibacteria group bacterium]